MLPCFLSGARSKHCFPFTQGDGCQHWYQRGRFSGCPVCFLPKIHSIFPSPPHLSLASLPFQVLSSLTQVGEESGTSRRWSGRLYTSAKYPLLYWRKGRHTHKKRVGQRGGGENEKRLVESGHETKIALRFNFSFISISKKWLF